MNFFNRLLNIFSYSEEVIEIVSADITLLENNCKIIKDINRKTDFTLVHLPINNYSKVTWIDNVPLKVMTNDLKHLVVKELDISALYETIMVHKHAQVSISKLFIVNGYYDIDENIVVEDYITTIEKVFNLLLTAIKGEHDENAIIHHNNKIKIFVDFHANIIEKLKEVSFHLDEEENNE